MSDERMKVSLTYVTAPIYWGKGALLSATAKGMHIHLSKDDCLQQIQRAARKLDAQGIKQVELIGKEWDLEKIWAFWLGFYAAKGTRNVIWPTLNSTETQQLEQRMKIVAWVREIINAPAEVVGPEQLAQRVVDLFCDIANEAVTYTLIKGEDLKQQGYHGLYTVGRGSTRSPVLLKLDYNPSMDPLTPVFAALVGKGITFDSGGYSLKQSNMMDSMKADMGGAATVAGALALAILQGLTQRVTLFLCCAENMVSGSACKLGDIIHYRNGTKVEVMNTDAEGRLVLADGLLDADALQPTLLIDCATLTGAAKVALGNDYHSLFTFDDPLAEALLDSAKQENEGFWRLPLAEFHRQQFPSNFADLSNVSSAAQTAGASVAAAFLSYFVTNYQQGWLHIDCSATYRKNAVDLWSAGATGIGVRTLAHFLLTQAKRNTIS